jgi:branched-chain amino acid transport system ATP-binding protein
MLELRGVRAGYGNHNVLKNVSLAVPEGSVVALLGANGAGKTTLLRVASGLIKPAAGSLVIDGEDVTGLRPHRLVERGVCHVPEGRGVFGNLTVRENLRLQSRKVDANTVERVIATFPSLGRRIDHLAGAMSGGEQQMLALARAYVQRPRVALLDEVSMGLAPIVVDEIFAFLRLLAQQGSSMLVVEQYVTRALDIADYVYLLNRGEVRFVGEPAELDGDAIFQEYLGVA